jgi:hypothetical protein
MVDRTTFADSPTRAPKPVVEEFIFWQVFVTFVIDGGEEVTVEYLVDAQNIGAAMEKAMQATFDAETDIDDLHSIVAKRMPAVIR